MARYVLYFIFVAASLVTSKVHNNDLYPNQKPHYLHNLLEYNRGDLQNRRFKLQRNLQSFGIYRTFKRDGTIDRQDERPFKTWAFTAI